MEELSLNLGLLAPKATTPTSMAHRAGTPGTEAQLNEQVVWPLW